MTFIFHSVYDYGEIFPSEHKNKGQHLCACFENNRSKWKASTLAESACYCKQYFCHLNKIAVNKIGFMLEYKSNEAEKAAVSCASLMFGNHKMAHHRVGRYFGFGLSLFTPKYNCHIVDVEYSRTRCI